MHATLQAYTQQNPALSPEMLRDVSDIAQLWSCCGAFPDQLIEYAGRVCYRSTHRAGDSPSFISARVKEGHEDIIEHVVVSIRFQGSDEPARWRLVNRHCEVAQLGERDWLVTGNTRVWLHLFREDVALEALPILHCISPAVFHQFDDKVSTDYTLDESLSEGVINKLSDLSPAEDGPMRVTMLGYTQPVMDDPVLLLDHGAATFLLEGISRTCTHQLVRHRLASYSQESQRYVDLQKGGWNAIVPDAVRANPEALAEMNAFWEEAEAKYRRLRDLGIRKEDARFLLPNAAETRIVVTMNYAAWSHFLWLRALDKAAQWEIRRMGQHILVMLHAIAPDVFAEHWQVYQERFRT